MLEAACENNNKNGLTAERNNSCLVNVQLANNEINNVSNEVGDHECNYLKLQRLQHGT